MSDAMPDAVSVNYDACETRRQFGRKNTFAAKGKSDGPSGAEGDEEEEEENPVRAEKQKAFLSSDAPHVIGNKTHAICVLAEDETLYDSLIGWRSEDGFCFRLRHPSI